MPSPKDVASHLKLTPQEVKYNRDIQRAHDEGFTEGKEALRKEAMDFLEREYMSRQINRGDGKASAILEVTRGLSQYLKNRIGR